MSRQLSQLSGFADDFMAAIGCLTLEVTSNEALRLHQKLIKKLGFSGQVLIQTPQWDTESPSQDHIRHLEQIIARTASHQPKLVLESLLRDLVVAGVSVAAGALAARISQRIEPTKNDISGPVIGVSISALIYPHIERLCRKIAFSASFMDHDQYLRWSTILERVVEGSNPVVGRLSERTQKAVQRIDEFVRTSLAALRDNKPMGTIETYSHLEKVLYLRQGYWIGQPRVFTNYYDTHDPCALKELVDSLPVNTRKEVRMMVNFITAASLRGIKNTLRPQFIISGNRGAGKTTTVRRLVKALGAQYIEIKSKRLDETDISGEQKIWGLHHVPGEDRNVSVKGLFRDRLRDTGVLNPICIIDEFSAKAMENSWKADAYKELFNPDVPEDNARSEFLGEENIAHVVFILITNDPLERFDPAFVDRFVQIRWPNIDEQTLVTIRDKCISETIAQLRESRPLTINGAIFDNILANCRETVDTWKDTILSHTKEGNGRLIQFVVRRFIDEVFMRRLLNETSHELAEEEVQQLIGDWSRVEISDHSVGTDYGETSAD